MSGTPLRNPTFKQQAHELVEHLPDDAGWRDLIYRAAVRQDIEQGLLDSDAGRVSSVGDVLKEFGLKDE